MSSVSRLGRVARQLFRWASIAAALFAGGWLVYSGNTHVDKVAPGITTPLMCVLTAMCLFVTTLAVVFRSSEAQ
jgi:hypothetical protein